MDANQDALGGVAAGAVAAAWDLDREHKINPSGVSGLTVFTDIGSLAFSGVLGAATLLATGGWGVVSFAVTQALTELAVHSIAMACPDITPQRLLTARRMTRAIIGTILGAATMACFAASGGPSLP